LRPWFYASSLASGHSHGHVYKHFGASIIQQ
jgi:hypothetical protein